MRVHVGSKNKTKVEAVARAFGKSAKFKHAEIVGVDVQVEEFGHPKNLTETVEGAKSRALAAFKDCDLSVGIEAGFMQVPHSKSGHMIVDVCAIYDGAEYHIGLTPAYEWPKKVVDLILNKGMDGSQAVREAGLTDEKKIGATKGSIYILTNGAIDRTEFNSFGVMMALVQLENPNFYQK